MLTPAQSEARYRWPAVALDGSSGWRTDSDVGGNWLDLPEDPLRIARDSRWPAFFPSPICLVSTGDGEHSALEKVVGASIVNRFPYIIALSFCIQDLSDRHYARNSFCSLLERTGTAAVQLIAPGEKLDAAMSAIASIPDGRTSERVQASGLPARSAITSAAPVFEDAYLVYEAQLVEPSVDFEGTPIFEKPWTDVGSHRVYYLKISTIQLQESVARGQSQIRWRSLPAFGPKDDFKPDEAPAHVVKKGYTKRYTPNYSFPASGTIAFETDSFQDGMAVHHVRDALITDNDAARWPCFFPQSAGIITSRSADGTEDLMPCGSTTMISRSPLIVAPCIAYASVNERYAPRATLDLVLESGWFGCGVPFIEDSVVEAIRYAGNLSLRDDAEKLINSGLLLGSGSRVPVTKGLPVFYECKVVGHQRLGTHIILFGEVQRIRVREDVTPENPLEWCPWPDVTDNVDGT